MFWKKKVLDMIHTEYVNSLKEKPKTIEVRISLIMINKKYIIGLQYKIISIKYIAIMIIKKK